MLGESSEAITNSIYRVQGEVRTIRQKLDAATTAPEAIELTERLLSLMRTPSLGGMHQEALEVQQAERELRNTYRAALAVRRRLVA